MAMEGTVQSIEVSAEPQHVFEVALDLEAYPDWIRAVKSVEVTEEDEYGRPLRAEFTADVLIKEIEYSLLYSYELNNGFSWTAEPGPDINAMEGSYEFNEIDGGGTEVLYALRVDPGFAIPGFLRKQSEKQLVSAALRGLKKRAESD